MQFGRYICMHVCACVCVGAENTLNSTLVLLSGRKMEENGRKGLKEL